MKSAVEEVREFGREPLERESYEAVSHCLSEWGGLAMRHAEELDRLRAIPQTTEHVSAKAVAGFVSSCDQVAAISPQSAKMLAVAYLDLLKKLGG